MGLILGRANHIDAHERAQGFRDDHAAVGLLVVFDNREPGSAYGESAAVQGVDVVGFTFAGFGADLRAAGLERFEV